MSHLFESIKVLNGRVRNLTYHQARVSRAFSELSTHSSIKLKPYIRSLDLPKEGVHKLRITYSLQKGISKHSITAYIEKEIKTLTLVETRKDYSHKFEDRDFINDAYANKGEADDVLFVVNGVIKDTSYCNIAFFDGKDWFTPKDPMLKGTMREQLLHKGVIKEKEILVGDLSFYKKARVFNAMINWSRGKEVEIEPTQ